MKSVAFNSNLVVNKKKRWLETHVSLKTLSFSLPNPQVAHNAKDNEPEMQTYDSKP